MRDHQQFHQPQIDPHPRQDLTLDRSRVGSSLRKVVQGSLPALDRSSNMIALCPKCGDEVKDGIRLVRVIWFDSS